MTLSGAVPGEQPTKKFKRQARLGERPARIYSAYLVAYLKEDGTYTLGVFSEPHPTIRGDVCTAVVAEVVSYESFADARERLLRDVRAGRIAHWLARAVIHP